MLGVNPWAGDGRMSAQRHFYEPKSPEGVAEVSRKLRTDEGALYFQVLRARQARQVMTCSV